MQITTTPIRRAPLAAAAFFTSLTAFVLFGDLVTSPRPLLASITPAHILTLAALVAAITAAHYVLPALRARAYFAGGLLALVAVAAIAYTLIASGMRGGAVIADRAAHAAKLDAQRADAKAAWQQARADLKAATDHATATRNAADLECAGGKGGKCNGKSSSASAAESVRVARDSHERIMRSTLDLIPPTPVSGFAWLAAGLADLGLGDAATITRRLEAWFPFAAVVISEFATIAFFALAFPATVLAMPATVAALPAPAAMTAAPIALQSAPLARVIAKRLPAPLDAHPVIAALRDARRPMTNDELAAAMGVTKGEASKRRLEVAEHLVLWREGRCLRAALRA